MIDLDAIGDVRRIVVLRALFLGDLLCAVPALDALDARFPDAEITMVGLPWARELCERLPAIDRFLKFPGYRGMPEVPVDEGRTIAFVERMRSERYDLAIQLHGSGGVSNGFVGALGGTTSLGYGPAGDGRLSTVLPWREEEHEVRRWLRLVAEVGADDASTRIDLPISEGERRAVDRLLGARADGDGPLVGLHVGAKDEARRWPAASFSKLGDELARRYGARIVLTGGPGERSLADELGARLAKPPLDLVGRTELGAFLALVGTLELLVTNDTGASHVAAATRTPSVVLFGPTRPARWAPLDDALHRVVDARRHVAGDVPVGESLRHLPVGPVMAACAERLGRPGERALGRAARQPVTI